MSHHVLGRYDLQLPPPPGEYALVFVAPNLEAAERDLNVIPRDFKFWVVLRDVIRGYQMAQPGIREEMTALVRELVVSVQIDPEMAERFRDIDPDDPESMQSLLSDAAGLVGSMEPAQREVVERMEAFVSLLDGYTAHVLEHLAADRIPSLREIEDAIERRALERGEMQEVFEEMMGFDLRRGSSGPGKEFCDIVVESEGIEALNRVFKDEASKPNLQELHHPDEWIARTVGRRG
jgi:putative hydrolase